ncbi:hypothetical protein DMA11_13805 [Marinilabiliaceae bacterium JC017]|nr:hypothetical protein DMA11_13805 [Marinilabiliaceae bacterium JC017]
MYSQTERPKENKSRVVANEVGQRKSSEGQGVAFVDNRVEAVTQRRLKKMIKQKHSTLQRRTNYAQQMAVKQAWEASPRLYIGSTVLKKRITFQPNEGIRTAHLANLDNWRIENKALKEIVEGHNNIFQWIMEHDYTNYHRDGLDGVEARILANNVLLNLLLPIYTDGFVKTEKANLFAMESNNPNLLYSVSDGSGLLNRHNERDAFLAGLKAWVQKYFTVRRSVMIDKLKQGANNGYVNNATVWPATTLGGKPAHMTIYNGDMIGFPDFILPLGSTMAAHIDPYKFNLIPNGGGVFGTHMTIETTLGNNAGNAHLFGNPANRMRKSGALAGVPAAVTDAIWEAALNNKILQVWNNVQVNFQSIIDNRA